MPLKRHTRIRYYCSRRDNIEIQNRGQTLKNIGNNVKRFVRVLFVI